jgi:AcrR family transcriptional regulator
MAGGTSEKSPPAGARPARRRLSSDERRKEFIRKSIELFAEDGFESSTRELARRLGVTQPLLYRYFPSKQDLVSAVYEEVYLRRWQPEWHDLIADRSRPLRDRLIEFYSLYTDAIFHPDWIRIYLYSGLKGVEINARYMKLIVERIFTPIFSEIRAHAGLPDRAPTEKEIDEMWLIHGGIFYFGVIKLVYQKTPPDTKDVAIGFAVDALIEGMKRGFRNEA